MYVWECEDTYQKCEQAFQWSFYNRQFTNVELDTLNSQFNRSRLCVCVCMHVCMYVCMHVCMKVTECANLRTSIWGGGWRYADRSRTCTCAWSLSGPRPACGGGGNSARVCGERRRCSRTCMRSPLSTSTSSPPWFTIDRYTYTKIFIHANLNTCIILHTVHTHTYINTYVDLCNRQQVASLAIFQRQCFGSIAHSNGLQYPRVISFRMLHHSWTPSHTLSLEYGRTFPNPSRDKQNYYTNIRNLR